MIHNQNIFNLLNNFSISFSDSLVLNTSPGARFQINQINKNGSKWNGSDADDSDEYSRDKGRMILERINLRG